MLNVMAGFDARDSTSLQREPEDYTRDLEKPLDGLRIGLPKEYFVKEINDDVARAVEAASPNTASLAPKRSKYRCLTRGCRCLFITYSRPRKHRAIFRASTACVTGIAHPEYDDLNDMYRKSRAQGFGAEVKRRILIGTYVLSHGYYDAYYIQAQKLRRLIAQDFAEAFKQCDIIMGPTSPTVAFNLGEKSSDPVQMYLSDAYTIAVNLAGLPGMSIPAGFGQQKQAGGLAHCRQLFCRSANAECGAPVPAGDRLAYADAHSTTGLNCDPRSDNPMTVDLSPCVGKSV